MTKREVHLGLWIDVDTGMVSQWDVGAWSPDGQPVALRVEALPFLLFGTEALDHALRYLAQLSRCTPRTELRPHPLPHVQPWDQLSLFSLEPLRAAAAGAASPLSPEQSTT